MIEINPYESPRPLPSPETKVRRAPFRTKRVIQKIDNEFLRTKLGEHRQDVCYGADACYVGIVVMIFAAVLSMVLPIFIPLFCIGVYMAYANGLKDLRHVSATWARSMFQVALFTIRFLLVLVVAVPLVSIVLKEMINTTLRGIVFSGAGISSLFCVFVFTYIFHGFSMLIGLWLVGRALMDKAIIVSSMISFILFCATATFIVSFAVQASHATFAAVTAAFAIAAALHLVTSLVTLIPLSRINSYIRPNYATKDNAPTT